jgi:DNA helicase II / ATP-dependent DNA helicase PcrA
VTMIQITSEQSLSDTEHHFRVTAGPGSGKTHWLCHHVRDVARNSNRLSSVAKIAVISHTNVAVRELLTRLGNAAGTTEIATIHSFLYRHVVRPYLHLASACLDNTPIAHHLVDGHDEHYPQRTVVHDWLKALKKGRLTLDAEKAKYKNIEDSLRKVTARVDGKGNAEFWSHGKLYTPEAQKLVNCESLLEYRKAYWSRGRLSHEDILFFAHVLLDSYPEIRSFLSARFPYLFIDEYQDTTTIPAAIVEWMAESGTVVGVIGDPAQSIFGFAGASMSHFEEFSLPEHRDYSIVGNRRATDSIVQILNRVRTDGLIQESLRDQPGSHPKVMSGNLPEAIEAAKTIVGTDAQLLFLARSHTAVSQVRCALGMVTTDPWIVLNKADEKRALFLSHLAEAIVLTKDGYIDVAIRRLVSSIATSKRLREPFQFEGEVTRSFRYGFSLSLLEFAATQYRKHPDNSCLDAFSAVRSFAITQFPGISIAEPTRGKFFEAAKSISFLDLLATVRTSEESRQTRTIHQAKGCEADACFVVLSDEAIDHLANPSSSDPEQQITYVAISRARDELFVYCPIEERVPELIAMGFEEFGGESV